MFFGHQINSYALHKLSPRTLPLPTFPKLILDSPCKCHVMHKLDLHSVIKGPPLSVRITSGIPYSSNHLSRDVRTCLSLCSRVVLHIATLEKQSTPIRAYLSQMLANVNLNKLMFFTDDQFWHQLEIFQCNLVATIWFCWQPRRVHWEGQPSSFLLAHKSCIP
jgi:hypothetical protein